MSQLLKFWVERDWIRACGYANTYYWILSDQKPKSALSSSCQDDALDEMFRTGLTFAAFL